ncbi:MAG: hypothetical protein ACE5HS_02835 [bacterium]
MKKLAAIVGFHFLVLVIVSCNVSVNKTVYVEDGTTKRGDINAVNGAIIVGEDCKVKGDCRTVNGRIEVGKRSRVEDVQSVNGRIELSEEVYSDGDIESVNGDISCAKDVEIEGYVRSVNGNIELYHTLVNRNVTTVNGNIVLDDESRLKGNVIIEGKRKNRSKQRVIKIKILNDSVVEGDIIVEDENVEVLVFLENGGNVLGKIENAEVVGQ